MMRTIFLILFISVSSIFAFSQESKDELELSVDIAIAPINFKLNATVTEDIGLIKTLADKFIKNDIESIEIVGHCTKNELIQNENISIQRAYFVRDILVKEGFPKNRIRVREGKDKFPNMLGEYIENARVNIYIL